METKPAELVDAPPGESKQHRIGAGRTQTAASIKLTLRVRRATALDGTAAAPISRRSR